MIIPERTIDVWTAVELARQFPGSLIWSPTTNEQAAGEPWDLDIRTPKLLLIESKGLGNKSQVRISSIQFANLLALEAAFAAIDGSSAVFYGLPLGQGHPVVTTTTAPGSILRAVYQRKFTTYHAMVQPSDLLLQVRDRLVGKKWIEISSIDLPPRSILLEEFLQQVRECALGQQFAPETAAAVIPAAVQDALDRAYGFMAELEFPLVPRLGRLGRPQLAPTGPLKAPTFFLVEMADQGLTHNPGTRA